MEPLLKAAVRERLVKAKELITPFEKWTQGAFARNRDNRICGNHTVGAVKFCMSGAIRQVGRSYDDLHGDAIKVIMKAMQTDETDQIYVSNWNDAPERTHQEVLDMFDKAIALVTP